MKTWLHHIRTRSIRHHRAIFAVRYYKILKNNTAIKLFRKSTVACEDLLFVEKKVVINIAFLYKTSFFRDFCLLSLTMN